MKEKMKRMERTLNTAKEAAKRHAIHLSLVIQDLKRNEKVLFQEDMVHASASMIKVPLMLAVIQEEGRTYTFSDQIKLSDDNAVDFSIVTQIEEGCYTILEYLQWMMLESCNASTNVLIDLIGFERVNRIFDELGMEETRLQRKMMDMEARKRGKDNTTTARDMATLLRTMYHREYFPACVCAMGLDLMKRCRDSRLLKRFLPQDVTLAHKTGGLDEVSHDAGIFFGHEDILVCAFATSKSGRENTLLREQTMGHIGRQLFKEEM